MQRHHDKTAWSTKCARWNGVGVVLYVPKCAASMQASHIALCSVWVCAIIRQWLERSWATGCRLLWIMMPACSVPAQTPIIQEGNQHGVMRAAFIRGQNSRFEAGSFHCGCLLYKNNINIECENRCPLSLYELTVPGRDIMPVVT